VGVSNRRARRVGSYVDELLGDGRPPRGAQDPDDLAALEAAIDLVAARPQAGLPSPRFVSRLEARIREQTQGEYRGGLALSRRGLLRAGGLAAAAGAGIVIDRALTERATPPAPDDLAVDGGRWHGVAAVDSLPVGRALRFSTAAVEGVVVNRGAGEIQAMMAVCTHLGCTLQLDEEHRRLGCPCGRAAFGYRGEVLAQPSAQVLRPLTRIPTRVRDGVVEVRIA
jgi:cytochrome b6-f complex iron-sulfur subunit